MPGHYHNVDHLNYEDVLEFLRHALSIRLKDKEIQLLLDNEPVGDPIDVSDLIKRGRYYDRFCNEC